ncbi:thioredoxin-disulfide reductase [Bacillaceae bacterium]
MEKYDVVIIGSGPAGIAASIWCKRLGLASLLLEKRERIGGQLHAVKNAIVDYPGLFGMDGKGLLSYFERHVRELDCPYRTNVDVTELAMQGQRVITKQGVFACEYVILATGAREKRLGVPGEKEMVARGEVYSASRDAKRFAGKRVVIVGGGDRAFEGALSAVAYADSVDIIHRSDRFRARRQFLEPVLRHPKVNVHTFSHLQEIVGQERVERVVVWNEKAGESRTLPADVVMIRIGIEPNSELVRGLVRLRGGGYPETDRFGETSVETIFAIGDVATAPEYSSISHAVGQAMLAVKRISFKLEQRKAGSGR